MKAFTLFLVFLIALINANEFKFTLEETGCSNRGEHCDATTKCCEDLTCSEFKLCRM